MKKENIIKKIFSTREINEVIKLLSSIVEIHSDLSCKDLEMLNIDLKSEISLLKKFKSNK
tara:strand:- start:835 stop:1014 length:180 start_codon:yes stop_codon:yes gene_type:complete